MDESFDPYHKWLAIPPEEQPPDHYRLLGAMLFEADPDVIDNAANQRMAHIRTFHQGRHSNLSQKLLNEIAAARVCLLKPEMKAQYDQVLKAKLDAAKPKALKAQLLRPEPVEPTRDMALLGDLAPSFSKRASAARKKSQKQSFPAPTLVGVSIAVILTIAGTAYVLTRQNAPIDKPVKQVAAKSEVELPPKPAPTAVTRQSNQSNATHQSDSHSTPPEMDGDQTATIASPKAKTDQEASANVATTVDLQSTSVRNDTSDGLGESTANRTQSDSKRNSGSALGTWPRSPLPNEATRREALSLVMEVYAADLAKAKQPADKVALVERLIEMADQSDQDAEQYALLHEAQELAIGMGQSTLAAQAIDGLAERFDLDSLAQSVNVAERIGKRGLTAELAGELCRQIDQWLAQALLANRFDVARRLVVAGSAAARKAKLTEESKAYTHRAAEIAQLQKQFTAFQRASDRVAANDDDAESHLEIGAFLCFGMRRWDQGLPHLAAGSNPDMKSAAAADLAKPMNTDDQIKVADSWWNLADHEKSVAIPLRERAAWWYRQALQDSAGLAKARIEKRLSQMRLPDSALTPSVSASNTSKSKIRKKPERWISQNASATPSSVAADPAANRKLELKPSLLDDSNDLYYDDYAFHTNADAGAHVIIDLHKSMMITRMLIRNRVKGYFDRAEGLSAWAWNSEGETATEIWHSASVEREWTCEIDPPVEARYIKVGLPPNKRNALHLSKIMIYGYDVPRKPSPAK